MWNPSDIPAAKLGPLSTQGFGNAAQPVWHGLSPRPARDALVQVLPVRCARRGDAQRVSTDDVQEKREWARLWREMRLTAELGEGLVAIGVDGLTPTGRGPWEEDA